MWRQADNQRQGELSQPAIEGAPSSEAPRADEQAPLQGQKESVRGREVPQDRPGERRIIEAPLQPKTSPDQVPERAEQPRPGLLRRHPFMSVLALLLFVAAGAATYIYWDYARHFESTDDAFIAARQFAIAPKVAGLYYGGARHRQSARRCRRRDRPHRRSRLPHRARSGASPGGGRARPTSRTSTRRSAVQQAQINADRGAGRAGAGGAGLRAAAGGALPAAWRVQARARFRTPSNIPRS